MNYYKIFLPQIWVVIKIAECLIIKNNIINIVEKKEEVKERENFKFCQKDFGRREFCLNFLKRTHFITFSKVNMFILQFIFF